MNDRLVQVQRRDSYGRTHIYPVNDAALTFAKLCGRKTLLVNDISLIELLGYTVEWVPMTVNLNTGEV